MTLPRRSFLCFASGFAGLAAATAGSRNAAAQAYPNRPVRWIVPFPAGGSTDIASRIICDWLSKRLGQQFIVENKPGGGTNIGTEAVAHAAPDGYTLLLALTTNVINPSLYKSLPFDFQRDIALVAGVAELPLVFDINPAVPARTVAEFIAYAKANPGKINFASFGARTISHLAIELFKSFGRNRRGARALSGRRADVDRHDQRPRPGRHRCAAQFIAAHQGRHVRALATLSAHRAPALPDVPTMSETIPGYDVQPWTALGVPTGTPQDIVETLHREVNAGLNDPGVKARLAEVGGSPLIYSTSEIRAVAANDLQKWAKVIEIAGIQPE